MPYTLFFDTETTGLPNKKQGAPLASQPHIIQLAFSLYNEEHRPVFELSTLVKLPEGAQIDAKAQEVHGISAEETRETGLPLESACRLLRYAAIRADYAVAHNASFDLALLRFSEQRLNAAPTFEGVRIRCTCDAATPILDLPPTPAMVRAGFNGPKRAKLTECWQHFFSEELEDAHDALVDTRGCARVYFHLLDKGVFND